MPTKRGGAQGNRGFNIADFRYFRDHHGILRNHDFHVEIPWPLGLRRTPEQQTIWRNLELACDSCNFPTTALQLYQVHRYSYGPMEKKPTIPQFGNLACTFVTDQYSMIWRFFHDWLRLIVNYDFTPNFNVNAPLDVYEISYTQEYSVDFNLYIYNPLGRCIRKTGFRQAYPVSVEDVPLAWAAGNQLIRIGVQFVFTDWAELAVPDQAINVAPPINAPGNVGPGLG